MSALKPNKLYSIIGRERFMTLY